MPEVYDYLDLPIGDKEVMWVDDEFEEGEYSNLITLSEILAQAGIKFSLFGDPVSAVQKVRTASESSVKPSVKLIILDAYLIRESQLIRELGLPIQPKPTSPIFACEILYDFLRESLPDARFIVLTKHYDKEDVIKFEERHPEVQFREKGEQFLPSILLETVSSALQRPIDMAESFLASRANRLEWENIHLKELINKQNIKLAELLEKSGAASNPPQKAEEIIFKEELTGFVDDIVGDRATIKLNYYGKLFARKCSLDTLREIGADREGCRLKISVTERRGGKFTTEILIDGSFEDKLKEKLKDPRIIERDRELSQLAARGGLEVRDE
jgi:hypothetical protein